MYLGNQGPEDLEDETSRRKNNVVMNLPKASRAVKGPRPILVFFWGQLAWTDANGVVDDGYSHGIRQRLQEYYAHDLSFVMHHVNREGDGSLDFLKYSRMLESSVFCLSPAGFAPWTKRLYEGEFFLWLEGGEGERGRLAWAWFLFYTCFLLIFFWLLVFIVAFVLSIFFSISDLARMHPGDHQ